MMQSKWFFPALIAAIGAGIYANCLHNGFTFDDWPLVVHNPMVIHPDVRAIFTSAYWPDRPDLGLFRPFTTLTYAINRWILGEAAFGYHLVNVILHTGNALLVLVCLRKFLKASGAMCCALIFLVHPLQTEAVNSIVGRAELLAVFCTLGAWFFLLYGKGYLRWILSATSLFFACLSKEQAAMMLFILALTAYLGRQEGGLGDTESRQRSSDRMNRFIRESLVGWALCLFAVLFFFWMRFNALGSLLLPGRPSFVDNPLAHVGILERWSTALTVIFDYASLIVWPWGLSADYSYSAIPLVSSFWHLRVGAGLLTVFSLIGIYVFSIRRPTTHQWALAAAWVALPALPISNLLFPIGTAMAERLMYAPVLGYAMFWGIFYSRLPRAWSRWATPLIGIAVAIFCLATIQRNTEWRSDQTLFASAVVSVPRSAKAQFNLGNAMRDQGDWQAALSRYRRAVWIFPEYAEVHYNIGVICQREGLAADALSAYRSAVSADENHVNAWINLGGVLAQQAQYRQADSAFSRAEAIQPDRIDVRFNQALLMDRQDRLDEAVERYLKVLAAQPSHEEAAMNLAEIYVRQGQGDRAIKTLEEIVSLGGPVQQAALNLATLFEKADRAPEAIQAYLKGSEGSEARNDLALLAAARLSIRTGERMEAQAALRSFLERWKGDESLRVRAREMLVGLNLD